MSLKLSPLDAAHRGLGAKMASFGGWEMPLNYPEGTLAEHRACRMDSAIFDVSHLGSVRVRGSGAFDRLQAAFTNDLAKVSPGRAQYTHLLDPEDASVLDDIIVWWVEPEWFEVMPNASNTDSVVAGLGEADEGVEVSDVGGERAVVAVQGPRARERLASVAPEAAGIGRFRVGALDWDGVPILVAGTGYTGEDGVECAVPVVVAERFWQALLDAGMAPAGLGARDTLRLEAGLPLHGHELGPGITPLQAGLGWVVAWDKGPFRGLAALEAERQRGVSRRLRGLVLDGRRPPRADQRVLRGGEEVGVVTSGNFSPELERGIALALLTPELSPGERVQVEIRGALVDASVVEPPFVARDR